MRVIVGGALPPRALKNESFFFFSPITILTLSPALSFPSPRSPFAALELAGDILGPCWLRVCLFFSFCRRGTKTTLGWAQLAGNCPGDSATAGIRNSSERGCCTQEVLQLPGCETRPSRQIVRTHTKARLRGRSLPRASFFPPLLHPCPPASKIGIHGHCTLDNKAIHTRREAGRATPSDTLCFSNKKKKRTTWNMQPRLLHPPVAFV